MTVARRGAIDRVLTGLSTAEIARAFLLPQATMAKRLVRAKHAHPLPCTVGQHPAAAGTPATC
jgi:predicted RNA polymerase sigma factor